MYLSKSFYKKIIIILTIVIISLLSHDVFAEEYHMVPENYYVTFCTTSYCINSNYNITAQNPLNSNFDHIYVRGVQTDSMRSWPYTSSIFEFNVQNSKSQRIQNGTYNISFNFVYNQTTNSNLVLSLNGVTATSKVLSSPNSPESWYSYTFNNVPLKDVNILSAQFQSFGTMASAIASLSFDSNWNITPTSETSVGVIGDTITDTSSPSASDMDFVGYLPTGPLDILLNLPLQFLNVAQQTFQGTCRPLVLTIPFIDSTLTLPCLQSYLSTHIQRYGEIITIVSLVADVFILYKYLMSLYKWCDDTLTLRENNQFGGY